MALILRYMHVNIWWRHQINLESTLIQHCVHAGKIRVPTQI